jgi:4-diphosphocytidyl-2-C-methyl-D-erythritol kinase
MSRVITIPAFAKINRTLRIIGKRRDGYHEIDTIFQTISLHDTIRIELTDERRIRLSCDDRSLPSNQHNLIYRAAAALQSRVAINQGARIRLEKRIPTHAGLGGGSSDAAVTLMALAHLWQVNITHEDLLEIAIDLGADVPFFFFGGSARGVGIGVEVTAHPDLPEQFLLIIKPNANISTRRAYELLKAPTLTTSEPKTILSSSLTGGFFDRLGADALRNDFEAVAFELAPEIARAKAALLRGGASAALLAGSGSAVFGIFDNWVAQKRAIQIIMLEPGWRVFPCRTVGRSHYGAAMGAAAEVFARFSGHDAGA